MTHMFVFCDGLNLFGTSSILFPFLPPSSHLLAHTGFSGTCCLCTGGRTSYTNQVERKCSSSYYEEDRSWVNRLNVAQESFENVQGCIRITLLLCKLQLLLLV